MRRTKKFIYHTYANLKPLSEKTFETVRKQTAKVLWVNDREGNCKCEYCQNEGKIEETKHLATAKCPSCGRKMTVRHLWRKNYHEDVDWRVTADSIEDGVIVYRYILCYRVNGMVRGLAEKAREVADYNTKQVYHIEHDYKNGQLYWAEREMTKNYFRETNIMSYWQENHWCCREALPLRRAYNVVRNTLSELKYCSFKGFRKGFYFPSVVREYTTQPALFEKLEKVGLSGLIGDYMQQYHPYININKGETELTKMLMIDKAKLNYLKSCKDHLLSRLEWLQSVDELTAYDIAHKVKLSVGEWKEITRNLTKGERDRNLKYCIKNELAYTEYARYLGVADMLGYDVHDPSYAYPKDFRKMDDKMSDEWDKRKDEMEKIKNAKKSEKIKRISEGLRKLPELQELLNGSKGFLVYVPESVEDLKNEGAKLHNCIGTYVDRVADGNTLLFFIRRLNDKDAPFVAMEYCHGRIIQCRYDYNKAVEHDCEIYSFAEKIADVMRKHKILAA